MRLIIYWLVLMVSLPLLYLFIKKKEKRIVLGIIIGTILLISIFVPSEMIHLIVNQRINQEVKKNNSIEEKLDHAILNNKQKTPLEKSIIDLRKKIGISFLLNETPLEIWKKTELLSRKNQEWFNNSNKEKKSHSILLFSQEFNQDLSDKANNNVIDFKVFKDTKKVQEKFSEIIQKNEEKNFKYLLNKCTLWNKKREFPIVFLKNIDKVNNNDKELEKLLLSIFNSQNNLWKYQQTVVNNKKKETIEMTPDLSNYIFLASSSVSKPKLSRKIISKLNIIEPFLDKYFWIIFLSSGLTEIIIFSLFYFLKKKNEKLFKKLNFTLNK